MKKKRTVLNVLEEILTTLKALVVMSCPKGSSVKMMTLAELRFSPDRMESLADGWFRDRFLTAYYGKNRDWSSESLERKLKWQEGEDYASKHGEQPEDFDLESLIDRSKNDPALVAGAAVLKLKTDDWYWSKRSYAGSSGDAWVVYPRGGSVGAYGKDDNSYVRPVRFSQ